MGLEQGLVVRKEHIEKIIDHCIKGLPNEACGIIASRDGEVTEIFPTENTQASPTNYTIDSKQQLKIYNEIEDKGWDLAGFFHSHVASEAYPSETDKKLSTYPNCLYFIVSLKDRRKPEIKAYLINKDKVEEKKFIIN